MNRSIVYNNYVIETVETKTDYRYIIKKEEKIIAESASGFPFPHEAEMQGKLYVNRLIGERNGWRIS